MKLSAILISIFFSLAACSGSGSLSDQGSSKIIPASVETAARKALEAYPELEDIKIEFVFKDGLGMHFMQAQPKPATIFKSAKQRTYMIKMTREMEIADDKKIPISEMPEKVLVGWFAHELGHIKDYIDKSSVELAWFGLRYYFSEDFKIAAERQADIYAIQAGFSNQIIATKNFILNNASLPDEYIEKIERLYLSPANVLDLVEDLDDEDDLDDAEEEIYGDS